MPYVEAIKKLEEINKIKSPILKMKVITKTVEIIKEEIAEFYRCNNIPCKINVNAD